MVISSIRGVALLELTIVLPLLLLLLTSVYDIASSVRAQQQLELQLREFGNQLSRSCRYEPEITLPQCAANVQLKLLPNSLQKVDIQVISCPAYQCIDLEGASCDRYDNSCLCSCGPNARSTLQVVNISSSASLIEEDAGALWERHHQLLERTGRLFILKATGVSSKLATTSLISERVYASAKY